MINEITSLFDDYTQDWNFSGAALIKQGDIPLFEYAAGYAHKGLRIPNTMTTMFDTASITKLFTAAGILLLENEGKSISQTKSPISSTCPERKFPLTSKFVIS